MNNDLELSILSCLILEPNLMDKLILEDKHFVKHQRLWQFMKSFYNKFKTFDIQLMASICKDKYHIVSYIVMLVDIEATTINFEKYQKQLIELYEESKKEKWIIERVYSLANDLYVRKIKYDDFKFEMQKAENDSKKLFGG